MDQSDHGLGDKDELEKLLSRPSCSIPDAGRALGISRNSAYEAVRRGEIPVLRFGRRKIVPTARLKQMLGIGE